MGRIRESSPSALLRLNLWNARRSEWLVEARQKNRKIKYSLIIFIVIVSVQSSSPLQACLRDSHDMVMYLADSYRPWSS
jgi:hypothetical protein